MNTGLALTSVINVDDLPDYPISCKDRLDSHYFFQWNMKRWRGSEFRRTVDPEAGWFGFQLFCIAQDETPVGTLPCDDKQLAYELRLPLERWQALLKRDVSPLHNWSRVRCDNGEIRLAHPVVTETAIEALGSKKRNTEARAAERLRKKLNSIAGLLNKEIRGGAQIAKSQDRVEMIHDWIEAQYPGRNATKNRVIEALNALQDMT